MTTYKVPTKEETEKRVELSKRFHTEGDVTQVFYETTKKSKKVYETGKIKVLYVIRPYGYDVDYENMFGQRKPEFEVYFEGHLAVSKAIVPKDVHNFVYGVGIGLGLLKSGDLR